MIDEVKNYIISLLEETSLTQVKKNALPIDGTMCASVRMTTKKHRYALAGNLLDAEVLCSVIVRGSDSSEETDDLLDEICEALELVSDYRITDGLKITIGTLPVASYIGEDENGNYNYNVDVLLRIG